MADNVTWHHGEVTPADRTHRGATV